MLDLFFHIDCKTLRGLLEEMFYVNKRIVVTGYKPHELGIFNEKHEGIRYIKLAIEKRLRAMLEEGLEWVIISGQQGVELWTAEVVFELQAEYPELQLAILLPFLEQEKNWKEEKQEHYQAILEQADYVNAITKRGYEGPWQFKARDRFLLDNSDGLLILYDEDKEGSPKYILEEAQKRVEQEGYVIYQINAYDLQLIVEELRDSFYGGDKFY